MSRDRTAPLRWFQSVPGGHYFWKLMAAVMSYASLILWFDDNYLPKKLILEAGGGMIISAIMGLLLAFRTNSAYDRWWEGRKLWGQLTNDTRNLCLKAEAFLSVDEYEQNKLHDLLIVFPYALKNHLRGLGPDAETLNIVPEVQFVQHVPLHIAQKIFALISGWKASNLVTGFELIVVDPHVRALMDVCGACERILKSPISGTYKQLLWIGLVGYLLLLPWLLVPTFDLWSLPLVFLTAYFIFALELLAEEVEEPFGSDINDLPLDALCQGMKKSIEQVAGTKTGHIRETDEIRIPDRR